MPHFGQRSAYLQEQIEQQILLIDDEGNITNSVHIASTGIIVPDHVFVYLDIAKTWTCSHDFKWLDN